MLRSPADVLIVGAGPTGSPPQSPCRARGSTVAMSTALTVVNGHLQFPPVALIEQTGSHYLHIAAELGLTFLPDSPAKRGRSPGRGPNEQRHGRLHPRNPPSSRSRICQAGSRSSTR